MTQSPVFGYMAYGLPVISEVELDGLDPVDPSTLADPVHICLGEVPAGLAQVELEDPVRQISATACLRHVPGMVRMLIEDGRRIVAQPEPGCPPVVLQNFLLGIGLGMAGFQRGYVPLHASAIEVDGACMAFSGQSGSGKSTTAALLGERGFATFADDLCLARLEEDAAWVGSGVRHLRLWDDAVARLGWQGGTPLGMVDERTKALYATASRPLAASLRLSRMYYLDEASETAAPGIRRVEGPDMLRRLVESLRLIPMALTTGQAPAHFQRMVRLASLVEVYSFTRPWDLDQLPLWIDRLATHFRNPAPEKKI